MRLTRLPRITFSREAESANAIQSCIQLFAMSVTAIITVTRRYLQVAVIDNTIHYLAYLSGAVGEVAGQLRDVGRRVKFVENDVHQARDLAAEADGRSLATETTVTGFSRRLERLEKLNEALRRKNAILRGQRPPDPPRPPRHRGSRYAPPKHPSASGEATGDTA
uniref:Uncharacterized protein n=1 Tax=Peronospora matthiolae TaxID=2874970 RepID=A0AAV1TXK7_9STRA